MKISEHILQKISSGLCVTRAFRQRLGSGVMSRKRILIERNTDKLVLKITAIVK
jgi:hypothetical protein